jgi:hypothetical protein
LFEVPEPSPVLRKDENEGVVFFGTDSAAPAVTRSRIDNLGVFWHTPASGRLFKKRGQAMSIPEIVGIPADPGEENPVTVRSVQIEGSPLQTAVGFPVTPVYTNRPDFPSERRYWQYFTNGMILCDANTCAQVLFGPILDYYATLNQFESPLGFPSTDVSTMPDGTTFVAFENGVLWLDEAGTIHNLDPVDPILVKAFSGIDPTPQGIAAFAQVKMNALAAAAIQQNPQLSGNVSSINASAQFDSVGGRGCAGASFDTLGHSLLRAHIFKVHFDFNLTGCAGSFGGASADLHITCRVSVSPAKVSAFLESFTIDAVSSPGGFGDSDINSGLSNALYAEYGVDLIDQHLPAGVNVLSAIVDDGGNVNVYQEPMCMSSAMLRRAAQPEAAATLAQIRQLRDKHLLRAKDGKQLVQLLEAVGPVLAETIRREKDSSELRERLSQFLLHNFQHHAELDKISHTIAEPGRQALALVNRLGSSKRKDAVETLLHRSMRFIREEISAGASVHDVARSLSRMLEEENGRIGSAK